MKNKAMVIAGLRFGKKGKKKEKETQVYPIIPHQLSQACQLARPYRPSLVLNLETIKEEDPYRTPSQGRPDLDPSRTPLYFHKGKDKSHAFRFRRYAKLFWKVHTTRIRCKLHYALRFLKRNNT